MTVADALLPYLSSNSIQTHALLPINKRGPATVKPKKVPFSLNTTTHSLSLFAMYASISKMKSDRKPPLPRSPMRLRPRRVLHSSNSTSLQTPPGFLTKYQKEPTRFLDVEESALRPEYRTISCELRALAKMVRDEFGNAEPETVTVANSCSVNAGVVFERGKFYDEYSAKRNERLKRKKGVTVGEGKSSHALGVTVESAKKSSSRKLGSLRKSVSAAYSMEVSETPRYMLRSRSKENKKPPLAANLDKSVLGEKRKMGVRRT